MVRHVIFNRAQIESLAAQFREFDDLMGVDFQYTVDEAMEPIRIEYLWRDE